MALKSMITGALLSIGVTMAIGVQANAAVYLGDVDGGKDPFSAGGSFMGSPGLAKCDTETGGGSYPLTCTDWEDSSAVGNGGDYSNAFSLVYDFDGGVNFTWTFDENLVTGGDALFPRYIIVKQAQSVVAWELSAAEKNGGFIQTSFGDISHVSFFDGQLADVPLPASLPLLAFGIGLLGISSRRRKS